jgi:hypothetical protein
MERRADLGAQVTVVSSEPLQMWRELFVSVYF